MNTHEDEKWHLLLARSAPAFVADATPPYGFVTSTLARLREEKREREQLEKIGLRALLASLVALAITVAVTVDFQFQDRGELEPGVKSLIQVENVPIS